MELLSPRDDDDVHPEPERTGEDREAAPRRRPPLEPEAVARAREGDSPRWELPPRRPRAPRADPPVPPAETVASPAETPAETPPLERAVDAPLHESWRGLDAFAAARRRLRRPMTTEERLAQSVQLEIGTGYFPAAPRRSSPEPIADPTSSSSLANSLIVGRPRHRRALPPEEIARREEQRAAFHAEQRQRLAEAQASTARLRGEEQARQERALQQQRELVRVRVSDGLEPITYGSPWPWVGLSVITGGGAVATLASMSSEQLTAVVAAVGVAGLYMMYYVAMALLARATD